MDVLFDMETRDPDDVFTLCFLLSHPQVRLRAITLNPGSYAQIGLVRHVLERLGRPDIPIGARHPTTTSNAVSPFHHTFLGTPPNAEPDAVAHELLAEMFATHPDAVWLTGAPLHNARLLLAHHPETRIARWVGQGGFAGDNVVPVGHRLPKFAGRTTCASHNFGGDPKGTKALLESPRVLQRDLVGKNVCHGVVYDAAFHARMAPYRDANDGLALIYDGMTKYLAEVPEGKMFHDPLAATLVVEHSLATWAEVTVFTERGEWGSQPAPTTGTFIAVSVDHERFFRVLTQTATAPAPKTTTN